MKALRIPMSLAILLFVTACVTINVYFPAEAAVKAADRIIMDVYGNVPDEQKQQEQPAEPTSFLWPSSLPERALVAVLDWLIAPAHAAADLSVDTPAIRDIRASMEARMRDLAPHYASGAIGMTNNGEIALRDLKLVPLRERNTVKNLVALENRDRSALYREIARANGQPEWEAEIRATFARRWVDNARSGWWYMDAGGNWKQK